MAPGRWQACIDHADAEVDSFVRSYFARPDRDVGFVGGAGFDPRAINVLSRLQQAGVQVDAILVREERPGPSQKLLEAAERNVQAMSGLARSVQLASVQMFGDDLAVVGGWRVTRAVAPQALASKTDVILDLSALSVGAIARQSG